jgi:hypothetical protein
MKQQDPKQRPLTDLDDPLELDFDDPDDKMPSTKRPSFDSQALAAAIETANKRTTMPPAPTYEMLRDSCRMTAAAEIAPELLEEPIDDKYPSTSAVHAKDSPAAQAARAAAAANATKKK